jgi:hypothetical protein
MFFGQRKQVLQIGLVDVPSDDLHLGPADPPQAVPVYSKFPEPPVDLGQIVGFAHADAGVLDDGRKEFRRLILHFSQISRGFDEIIPDERSNEFCFLFWSYWLFTHNRPHLFTIWKS